MSTRKSTAALEMSGTLKRNPGRYAQRSAVPDDDRPLGNAPARLSADEAAIWNELVDMLPENVPVRGDRVALETLAKLFHKFTTGAVKPTELSIMSSLLGRFGLTPADRCRVSARPRQPKNKFSEMAAEMKRNQVQ